MLNQKNYTLKAKRITAAEIDEIKQNIRHKIGDDTEDYTNKVNGDWMDTHVIEHQQRETKKVKILASVKQRITNTQVLKESSMQVGIS